jgi:hypothetical protein
MSKRLVLRYLVATTKYLSTSLLVILRMPQTLTARTCTEEGEGGGEGGGGGWGGWGGEAEEEEDFITTD